MNGWPTRPILAWSLAVACTSALGGCGDDESDTGPNGGTGLTGEVGTFDGLFDDVVTGYNFPLDIGIVPNFPAGEGGGGAGPAGGLEVGDIVAANYGTSQVLRAPNPSGPVTSRQAQGFYDGTDDGLAGTTGVALTPAPHHYVWASFEQGGDGDAGGVVVLSPTGEPVLVLDNGTLAGSFDHPGGICYGGADTTGTAVFLFVVNMGDGTAWRLEASGFDGTGIVAVRVGSGLATGTPGSPGTPGQGITNQNDLPGGGARGCAYHNGSLYVADAQNERIVRFDAADQAQDVSPSLLDDAPAELLTYPTGVTVNHEGSLIVVSFDDAHAFVSLDLPTGRFIDNGLNDLNVNAGNHGVQVAGDTIWFTRANTSNGALRAITIDEHHPPSTGGLFPVQ